MLHVYGVMEVGHCHQDMVHHYIAAGGASLQIQRVAANIVNRYL